MAMKIPDRSKFWLWWTFQDTDPFTDKVQGKELSGSATGQTVSGHVNKWALEVDQSNSEEVTAADASWNSFGDEEITMGGWFYFNSIDNNKWLLMGKRDGTDPTEEYWIEKDDAERIGFQVGDTNLAFVGQDSVSAGNWYYIEGWHDPSGNQIGVELYNTSGNLIANDTDGHSGGFPSTDVATFAIGSQDLETGGRNWNADIYAEQIFVYKGLFTSGEREWMVNGGAGRNYEDLLGVRIIGVV